jgi:hypothetical protein
VWCTYVGCIQRKKGGNTFHANTPLQTIYVPSIIQGIMGKVVGNPVHISVRVRVIKYKVQLKFIGYQSGSVRNYQQDQFSSGQVNQKGIKGEINGKKSEGKSVVGSLGNRGKHGEIRCPVQRATLYLQSSLTSSRGIIPLMDGESKKNRWREGAQQ